ncbi:MAG: tRNA 2-thiouridine(34) synthase MnmA [Simkaniaceae bacterium]|nr:tRNA 2-thiouridine(34) synthase MnmA [Simkaniaceae bacterium]
MEKPNHTITVAVGMSGGVDSSVAAYLLKKAGYRVIGLFMRNWDEKDSSCPAAQDYQDVISVCSHLDIPYYTFNFADEYYDNVFADFIEGLKLGITPNPDIFCNKEIKFKVFLEKALEIGADYLATGHWAKVGQSEQGPYLAKCADLNKDQTYFLYTLKQKQLEKVLFPLEHLTKPEARQLAKEIGLSTHDKKDSTGICFIGKRKFKDFIETYIPRTPGNFVSETGEILGRHDGIAFYTIGQRKGLKVGGPGDAWYVADKKVDTNEILLVQGENNPLLYTENLQAANVSWTRDDFFLKAPFECTAKVRYRQDEQPCVITPLNGNEVSVRFKAPQRATTPGQSIVFYRNDECLGGAIITSS